MSETESINLEKTFFGSEAEPAVQYTLPFNWGTFRVSEAAHKAYGFTPLTADKIEGSSDHTPTDKPTPRIDILLVSPEEVDDVYRGPSHDTQSLSALTGTRLYAGGIKLACGLNKDKRQMAQMMKDDFSDNITALFQDSLDPGEKITPDKVFNPEGIPVTEIVDQQVVTQSMMQAISTGLNLRLIEDLPIWFFQRASEEALDSYSYKSRVALAGTAAVIAAGTSISIDSSTYADNLAAGGAAIGFTAFALHALKRSFSFSIQNFQSTQSEIRETSLFAAENVSMAVFNAYSTENFDLEYSKKFGPSQ